MKNKLVGLFVVGLIGLVTCLVLSEASWEDGKVEPANPAPAPCPPDGPCPPRKPRPWGPQGASGLDATTNPGHRSLAGAQLDDWITNGVRRPTGAKVGGPVIDGTEIQVDLPGSHHRKNTASKGLGLCVFTSIHHAADWQGIDALLEMPRWMIARGIPGGGYPAKVQQLIPRLAQERGLATPEFVQAEHYDYELLKTALQSGRLACVTYSKSPTGRYGGGRISHMVNAAHADNQRVAILDNNYVGEQSYEWMTPEEARRAGVLEWMIVFTDAPPPPPPHNGGPAPKPQPSPAPLPLPSDEEEPKPTRTCPCSPQCTCGCNQGEPCTCGDPVPARQDDSWKTQFEKNVSGRAFVEELRQHDDSPLLAVAAG
jgi:hypothetical protein